MTSYKLFVLATGFTAATTLPLISGSPTLAADSPVDRDSLIPSNIQTCMHQAVSDNAPKGIKVKSVSISPTSRLSKAAELLERKDGLPMNGIEMGAFKKADGIISATISTTMSLGSSSPSDIYTYVIVLNARRPTAAYAMSGGTSMGHNVPGKFRRNAHLQALRTLEDYRSCMTSAPETKLQNNTTSLFSWRSSIMSVRPDSPTPETEELKPSFP